MSRNNVKLLEDSQLRYLKSKYIFEILDDSVVVSLSDYGRITYHDKNKPFSLNTKVRRISFTVETIKIWEELLKKNESLNLIDVQQAVNQLYILYLPATIENVRKILSDGTEIQNI